MQTLVQHAEKILRYYNTCGAIEHCRTFARDSVVVSGNLCLNRAFLLLGVLYACRNSSSSEYIHYTVSEDMIIDSIHFTGTDVDQWTALDSYTETHHQELGDDFSREKHEQCMIHPYISHYSDTDMIINAVSYYDIEHYVTFCVMCVSGGITANRIYCSPLFLLSMWNAEFGIGMLKHMLEVYKNNGKIETLKRIAKYIVDFHSYIETSINNSGDGCFSEQYIEFKRILTNRYRDEQYSKKLGNLMEKLEPMLQIDPKSPIMGPKNARKILRKFALDIQKLCDSAKIDSGFDDLL